MHPKAAYCALVGLQPMRCKSAAYHEPRIRFHHTDMENQLRYYDSKVVQWHIEKAGTLDNYTPTTWEEIPDEILDKLSIEKIDYLRDHP